MWSAEPYLGIEGKGNRGMLGILSLLVTTGGSFMYRMRDEMIGQNPELNELGRYYREWEVISRYGSVGFFFYDISKHARYTIGLLAFLAVAGPWFLVSTMTCLIGAYPLVGAIALARGFYQLASRSGHLLCLGVTMAVTALSWLVYHKSFADPHVLWMVALGTGIISGAVTEVARRVLLAFYASTTIGRMLADEEVAWEIVAGDERGYIDVMFKFGALWFQQSRLARMFRAICFDTSVAQPI